jgi:hypothetical protein
MEPTSSDNLLPIQAVDRLIGSYAGGMNTENYYYAEYVGEQPKQTPANYIEVNEDGIPIVYINGTSIPATASVQKPGLTPQEGVVQQGATKTETSAGSGTTELQIMSPSGLATTVINAVFSIAVTIAIIMGIVVTYLIIRTRQLHHHEEHVRAAAPGGHGDTHGHDTHAHDSHGSTPVDTHTHDTHAETVEPHAPFEHPAPSVSESFYTGAAHPDAPAEYPGVTLLEEGDIAQDVQVTESATHGDTSLSDVHNRFSAIRTYVAGDDPVTWRHALMDIDLVLEDMLARKGLEGNSTAERLAHADARHLTMLNEALTARAYYEELVSGVEPITHESMQRLLALYTPVLAELGLK